MRRDGGSVFPAHANTGDPNGPNQGLSANEIARALISMMARGSKCSNQRPDTLMQDRYRQIAKTSCDAQIFSAPPQEADIDRFFWHLALGPSTDIAPLPRARATGVFLFESSQRDVPKSCVLQW